MKTSSLPVSGDGSIGLLLCYKLKSTIKYQCVNTAPGEFAALGQWAHCSAQTTFSDLFWDADLLQQDLWSPYKLVSSSVCLLDACPRKLSFCCIRFCGMKKENMHKLNLGCSEADHKQPRERTEEDKDIFINTKKEFRKRKSCEFPWLQELLLPKKNWEPGI